MKKYLPLFIILFSYHFCFAQGDYYNSLDSNRRCQDLKNTLSQFLNTGISNRTYEEAFNFMADYDIVNIDGSNYIWDIYSYNPNGTQYYTYKPINKCSNETGGGQEGICWNREHVFPSSWFNAGSPMYGDFINLLPADGYINSRRGNMPHGTVQAPISFTSKNGSKLGNGTLTSIVGTFFEPIDEFKGDIARILLYMSVRYQDQFFTWNNTDFMRVRGTDTLMGFREEYLNLLIAWHEADPPSQKEIDRNDRIFAAQGNRNPFVDFPQFVTYIWKSDNCAPVGVKNYKENTVSIYPNPVIDELKIQNLQAQGLSYFIMDISGRVLRQGAINSSSISVSELSDGSYFLFIEGNQETLYNKFVIAR